MKTAKDISQATQMNQGDIYAAIRCHAIERPDIFHGCKGNYSESLFNKIVKRIRTNAGLNEKTI